MFVEKKFSDQGLRHRPVSWEQGFYKKNFQSLLTEDTFLTNEMTNYPSFQSVTVL